MAKRVIAIKGLYDRKDERLTRKVSVPCAYADKAGIIRSKEVRMSEAEKRTIEAIAMRLFLEHRKVVKSKKQDDGRVLLSAAILIGDLG